MSLIIEKESLPLGREVDIFVYNRDISHENESNQAERLLSLSSKVTYIMNDKYGVRTISKINDSKFNRRVVLTDFQNVKGASLIEVYEKILRFAKSINCNSIELPFIGENKDEYNFVKDYLNNYANRKKVEIYFYIPKFDAPSL